MGYDIWRVEFTDRETGEPRTRAFDRDEGLARLCVREWGGKLFRREDVGGDDGTLSMNNPEAYDWKEVTR